MTKEKKETKQVFHKGLGLSKTSDGEYSIDVLEYTTDGFLKVTSTYKTTNHVDALDRLKITLMKEVRP